MADFNQLIIEKGIEHWPVLAGMLVMLFAMWKWIIPNSVKSSLENGGGDAVKRVVKSELNAQDERIDKRLEEYNEQGKDRMLEIISKHEELSRVTMQNLMLKFRGDTDVAHNKLSRSFEELDERTTHIERKLKMKRRAFIRSDIKDT
jgi:hypothetical protein